MKAWHEKKILEPNFPFKLWVAENVNFSPHWHQEIEIIYVVSGTTRIGINNKIYNVSSKDILLISGGEVHYFLSNNVQSKIIIIQFGLSLFDNYLDVVSDKRFVKPLLRYLTESTDDVYKDIEKQILLLVDEYKKKQKGYKLSLKARVYDLVVILLRRVCTVKCSPHEKTKQLVALERLAKVFEYVEQHYQSEISLEQISKVANFSIYHFTRFFKNTIGMTFGQYLSNFRIRKAQRYLIDEQDSIIEIAYNMGFKSIKTFNRVFKKIVGCTPTEYRKESNF